MPRSGRGGASVVAMVYTWSPIPPALCTLALSTQAWDLNRDGQLSQQEFKAGARGQAAAAATAAATAGATAGATAAAAAPAVAPSPVVPRERAPSPGRLLPGSASARARPLSPTAGSLPGAEPGPQGAGVWGRELQF